VEPPGPIVRHHPTDSPRLNDELERLHPFKDLDSRNSADCVPERARDLRAGTIAPGVQDPLSGMRAFETEE
jgi:hypothetical protein